MLINRTSFLNRPLDLTIYKTSQARQLNRTVKMMGTIFISRTDIYWVFIQIFYIGYSTWRGLRTYQTCNKISEDLIELWKNYEKIKIHNRSVDCKFFRAHFFSAFLFTRKEFSRRIHPQNHHNIVGQHKFRKILLFI